VGPRTCAGIFNAPWPSSICLSCPMIILFLAACRVPVGFSLPFIILRWGVELICTSKKKNAYIFKLKRILSRLCFGVIQESHEWFTLKKFWKGNEFFAEGNLFNFLWHHKKKITLYLNIFLKVSPCIMYRLLRFYRHKLHN